MKLNIATKINLLTVSLIVIFTSFLGWLFVRHETSAIKTELDERAITIVNNLAYNSEYGVLVGDKEGLIRLLEGIIKEKDISYAIIEDVKGDLIAEVGEKEKVLIKEFTAPIVAIQLSKDAGKEELSIIPEIREKGKEKKLGMVRLGVSLRGLYQKTTQIKKVMLFSVIVIILISSLVVIFAVRFLITRPLKPLMLGVEKIRTGDLSHRVKIKSQDELGEFANSFNKMTEDLSRVTVSKDYVDNIIKSMIDTLIVTDAKGKIKTVNQATLNLLGYEEEEIIGKPAGILFAEELLFKGTKWEKLLKEGSARDYQITYKTKTGEKIPVSFSGSIMRDKEGELIGIVGIAHDMRQIIALQEKEITAKAEAEKAAISRVSGVLAHEMNTPLMGILGLARILEKNIDLKESDLKENTVTIQQLTYKCSEIVKKIATLAKPVELKFDKISKNEFIDIVENALSVLRGSFQANQIEVIKSYTADEFTVKIDRNEMSSVFSNILTNSIKAMPDGGGKLTISISCHTERSEVSQKQDSSASPQNDFVEVVFKDTGKGIEKENLKKIFELYFSELKADIGGIGLGLSESQKIVKQHGGEIFVESDGLDKGATFKVVLPVLSATGGRINSCLQK